MNTIGNQTGTHQTLSEAGSSLKGTSINVSTADGRGVASAGARVVTNAGAIRQTAQITGNMILSQMKPGTSFAGDIIDVYGNAIKLLLSGEKMLSATATDARNLNIGDHIIFNVSSNNGSSVVIKPVKVNHFNTNMLLRALEAAEIPATEKNKNIIRAMMEHEMPIDKNTVTEMMKKVEVFKTDNPEHIVSMEKHGIPLTQGNLEQFNAYKGYEHRIILQTETFGNDIPQLLSELTANGEDGKAIALAKGFIDILEDNLLYDNDSSPQTIMKDNENISEKQSMSSEQIIHKFETLSSDELKMFIESDDFKDFIKDKVERSFEININQLSTDDDETKELIKKLYENLDKKTNNVLELMQNVGEGHGKIAQTASNIRDNMQFMQDLSQMASYIQLPVKFNQGKAHSELYVYNRKKGMPVDKDIVTAFLHLDMDSLGATDINITMERQSVTTQFSLSDEVSMHIVEENLYTLKESLEKKGYIANFTVDTKLATDEKPFDKMLETDKPQISIKRYSFDVRA